MTLQEIKTAPVAVYGIPGTTLIPLTGYQVQTPEERIALIEEILRKLSENETVILNNTLVFTEAYDGFRVI